MDRKRKKDGDFLVVESPGFSFVLSSSTFLFVSISVSMWDWRVLPRGEGEGFLAVPSVADGSRSALSTGTNG
jgi:hypothetical protein